ncbi:MAG TPA: DNA cytosine methyltransferase [Ktedonobacteraceae bacterium]|nr:DNA cytosine methyltransferase [Ktedonobacteraceae bacterium]
MDRTPSTGNQEHFECFWSHSKQPEFSSLDICSGAGGEALGLEAAGFAHAAVIDIDPNACATLRLNRPTWSVFEKDVREVEGQHFRGIDLLAGGVPCPPFTIAGKQLGAEDERDVFPEALRLVEQAKPAAVLLENVPGLATTKFTAYRQSLIQKLHRLGYEVTWRILNASSYGVPQLRPRFILVAMSSPYFDNFHWPLTNRPLATVGETLYDLMAAHGWPGARKWAEQAKGIAPTLVGGSKKHGGPDLGPTRARQQWAHLGVDGKGIADTPPAQDFPVDGLPRLTLRMTARLQAFPDTWTFAGGKTAAYRQIGNALPPPVAYAVGKALFRALKGLKPEADRPIFYQPLLLHP